MASEDLPPEEQPPDEPGRYEAEKQSTRHNRALFGVGIAVTSLGGASTFLGLAGAAYLGITSERQDEAYVPAVVAIVGGVVMMAAGIPMILIGGKRKGPNTTTTPMGSAPRWLGAPHGAGWAWTF